MAFIKFKPLTPKFNFQREITEIPKYVHDYLDKEDILFAFQTSKDVALFTNKKIILFNKRGFGKHVKEVSSVPYHSIITSAVFFGSITSEIKLTLYNNFPLTLSFFSSVDKVTIKKTYMLIEKNVKNKF